MKFDRNEALLQERYAAYNRLSNEIGSIKKESYLKIIYLINLLDSDDVDNNKKLEIIYSNLYYLKEMLK